MANQGIKSALESLLFVWGDPLDAKACAELFGLSQQEMLEVFRELKDEYEEKHGGLLIKETDKSFQLVTNPDNDDYIRKLCTPVRERRLSQSALEVLAIIAYKQPVTKSEIDSIRGIRSDRVLEGLMKRELVEEKGRAQSIGRPILYGTTKTFLRLFGFEKLSDLPELDDIDELIPEDSEADESLIGQLSMQLTDEISGREEADENE